MKKQYFFSTRNIWLLLLTALMLNGLNTPLQAQKRKKTRTAVVAKTCSGISYSDRTRVSIARFSVTNRNAQQQFGNEISTLLSNALVETNCFQVLARLDNATDWEREKTYQGQTGAGLSPQLIVTGEVVEYQDEFVSVSVVGVQRAQIGFVLQVLNPATRQIIFSRSFNKKKNKPGAAAGIRFFGRTVTGVNLKTQAMADILEESLLEAIAELVDGKDEMLAALGGPESQATASMQANLADCKALTNGNAPSVMVVIPEVHISRPAPDPAGETEIIRQLTNAGFRVIDPSVYASIRANNSINARLKDASEAAALGAQFGADIIIVGEAFSELAGREGSMFSCQARVEARAISTTDASIIGADGQHAGGADVSELTASKMALRNAGAQMANYFIGAICNRSVGAGSAGAKRLIVDVANASFSSLSSLEQSLKTNSAVSSVKKNMSGNIATIEIQHSTTTDDIANILMNTSSVKLEITEFGSNKIGILIQ